MAGEPERGSQDPSSLWAVLGQAFGVLRERPMLVLTLAFGILAVGGAGVLQTDGADRVIVLVVLGVLVLLFAIGLVAGRDRKPSGAAGDPSAQADRGVRMRVVMGDGSTLEAEDSLNVTGSGPHDTGLEFGDQGRVKLKNSMNEGPDKAE